MAKEYAGRFVDGKFHRTNTYASYDNPAICFTCDFWNKHVEHDKHPEEYKVPFVCNGEHYIADINPDHSKDYFKGFGGAKVEVTFLDTNEVHIYDNVWYQGEIPANFKKLFPDTAIMRWL